MLSFAVIGIMWQTHHALFRTVARVDRMTVFLNLLLLAGTAFIPFATSTLGTYPAMHASTFLYGLVLTTCSTFYNLMLLHNRQAPRISRERRRQTILATIKAYRVGWVGYTLATLLAIVDPVASFVAYLLIAAYYIIPRGVDSDVSAPA